MKKTMIICLLVVGHLLTMPLANAAPAPEQQTNACSVSYAKWARAAKERLRTDYPNATAVDFLFVGCKPQSPTTKYMMYKYWMSEGGREFGVYVTLLIDMKLNRVTSSFTEKTDATISSYGKWRRIAVEAIQNKYGDVTIIDYRPCSCDAMGSSSASQTFKFWIEQDRKLKFVYVTMKYRISDERIRSITFEERER